MNNSENEWCRVFAKLFFAMKDTLRVSLVQCSLQWEDKTANLSRIEALISGLEGRTDLVILPEMFSTGFSMQAAALAEPMDGPTMNWLALQAGRLGAVVTGSFIAAEKGRFHNRLVWMSPGGNFSTYDKRHCFSPAGEQDHYTPGERHLIAEVKGWKVMPLICYDLRFPVWSRNVQGYDLLVYVANWPEKRSLAWNSLIQARAIENQVYTIGVNRVGTDGNGISHSGDSAVVNYLGEVMHRSSGGEDVFTLDLSFTEQQAFRRAWPFLADRDSFELSLKK